MSALVKQHDSAHSVKVVRQTDDVTIVEVNPTPFGSPKQKDLHGEYFHEDTYFGDDYVQTKFGLYEHLLNDQVNPAMQEMGKKAQILGPATLVRKDEAGRWFEIEIQRSLEYHDYLVDMIQKGLMGASTQVFPNGRESDDNPKSKTFGRIDVWIENEVSLTPTPANPKTIQLLADTVKSHQMPPLFLVKNDALIEVDEELAAFIASGEEFDFEEELQDIIGEDAEPLEEDSSLLTEEEETALAQLDDGVKAAFRAIVKQEVADIKAWMDLRIDVYGDDIKELTGYISQMMSGIENLSDEQQKALKGILATQKGLTTYMRWMKEFKISEAGEAWKDMSEWEKELALELEGSSEPQKRFSSPVPRGAPGTRD